jgi:hypothetical protein
MAIAFRNQATATLSFEQLPQPTDSHFDPLEYGDELRSNSAFIHQEENRHARQLCHVPEIKRREQNRPRDRGLRSQLPRSQNTPERGAPDFHETTRAPKTRTHRKYNQHRVFRRKPRSARQAHQQRTAGAPAAHRRRTSSAPPAHQQRTARSSRVNDSPESLHKTKSTNLNSSTRKLCAELERTPSAPSANSRHNTNQIKTLRGQCVQEVTGAPTAHLELQLRGPRSLPNEPPTASQGVEFDSPMKLTLRLSSPKTRGIPRNSQIP